MGAECSGGTVYKSERMLSWKPQFEALGLRERDIQKLLQIFRKVDVDGSGHIELGELLAHIDLERTRFTERIFSIFDEDGSGQIDFREFVLSMWNYCTLGRATLDLFAFDLYDVDSSGFLSTGEIDKMLRDIYGSKNVQTNVYAKSVAKDLKSMGEENVDVEKFREFTRTHQALLFPAFEMQTALQRNVLGVSYWTRNANKRIEVSNGRYIPIAKFMELHVNKKLMEQHVSGTKTITAPMKRKAKMALDVTGTHGKRKQTQASFDENTASFEVRKDLPLDGGGEDMLNSIVEMNKKISATLKTKNADAKSRNTSISSVPDDSRGPARKYSTNAVVPFDTLMHDELSAPSGEDSYTYGDGNPSAGLQLFEDMKDFAGSSSSKKHTGRRHSSFGIAVGDAGAGAGGGGRPQPKASFDSKRRRSLDKIPEKEIVEELTMENLAKASKQAALEVAAAKTAYQPLQQPSNGRANGKKNLPPMQNAPVKLRDSLLISSSDKPSHNNARQLRRSFDADDDIDTIPLTTPTGKPSIPMLALPSNAANNFVDPAPAAKPKGRRNSVM